MYNIKTDPCHSIWSRWAPNATPSSIPFVLVVVLFRFLFHPLTCCGWFQFPFVLVSFSSEIINDYGRVQKSKDKSFHRLRRHTGSLCHIYIAPSNQKIKLPDTKQRKNNTSEDGRTDNMVCVACGWRKMHEEECVKKGGERTMTVCVCEAPEAPQNKS